MINLSEMDTLVRDALQARLPWEDEQIKGYKLRHEGLGRPKKPWAGAADLNWPLSDMMIEKIKPYYIQQVFANELVANFFSLKSDLMQFNNAAAQWFDYRLRQRTNFETEIISVADYMLMAGKGLLKVYWDEGKRQVKFDSVDPMYFIVPTHTTDLRDADWCAQVHQISPAAYKRNENYNQSPELLTKIRAANAETRTRYESEKYLREGITHSVDDDRIPVWEVYYRDGKDLLTFTFSPLSLDEFVRPIRKLPYDHGHLPYVEFNVEVKDKGYYSPRGIPARIAPLQQSMTKLWNEKLDAVTIYSRPIFTSDNPMVNAGNIRMQPGQIIPFPVKAVSMGAPPVSWDQEIAQQRLTAEQLIGIPDAGLQNQFKSGERRTASEVNLIGTVMSQVTDLRSRIFRRALAETFAQAWGLYVQYDKADLHFFYRNELMTIPPEAVQDGYRVEPLASADNFNKQFVYQKKVTRFQLLQQNPFVNQAELVRDLIAADDPQDVKRIFMDNDAQSADQSEDQATELCRMMIGFPSQVKPVDDDATHLMILRGFVERRISADEGIDGELAALLMNHANMHMRQLQQKNPEQAKQLEEPMQQMAQYFGQVVAMEQQANQQQQQQQMQMQGQEEIPQEALPEGI